MAGLDVLIANVTLAGRTGIEIVTRDLAVGLRAAGHRPTVYSPRLGDIASEIAAAGIPVVTRPADVPRSPQIVHGNHHVELMTALWHFPTARGLFVCHDRTWYGSAPPRMQRVERYVAVDLYCLRRLIADYAIPEERTRVIYNWVDTMRFQRRPPLPQRPRKAAIFSNYAGPGTHMEPVQAACARLGISLDVIGSTMGTTSAAPEHRLGAYHVVFAKARCALEAMATGVAVVLCDLDGHGPMVTSKEVSTLQPWNFGRSLLREPLRVESSRSSARFGATIPPTRAWFPTSSDNTPRPL